MLPFSLELQPGQSTYLQVVYAVKKAIVSGRLRPGDSFPSVRSLSLELKINPNTAHRVVAALTGEGLLEVRPGIGTRISEAPHPSPADRRVLLEAPLERVVVEAKNLGLQLNQVIDALSEHWSRLSELEQERGSGTQGSPNSTRRTRGPESESEETR